MKASSRLAAAGFGSYDFGRLSSVMMLAVIDDGDLFGGALDFFHVMRREEDRQASLLIELLHICPDVIAASADRGRASARPRIDGRRMQEAAGDLQAALHAAGESLDQAVLPVPELHEIQHLLDRLGRLGARHAIQAGVEEHVLVSRELVVERRILEDDAERLRGHRAAA